MAMKTFQLSEYIKQISLRKLSVPTSPDEEKCVQFAVSLNSSLNSPCKNQKRSMAFLLTCMEESKSLQAC